MIMQNVLEKEAAMHEFSQVRESLMYEVFLKSGTEGFVKKFNSEREARPLVKHNLGFL